MPKGKAKPPENVATLTTYVDLQGQTAAVAATARGIARLFLVAEEGEAPAARAQAWARELGADSIEAQPPKLLPLATAPSLKRGLARAGSKSCRG